MADESRKREPGLSIVFSKTKGIKKLKPSTLVDDQNAKEEDPDFVTAFEDRRVRSSKPKEERKPYVIPLIKKNVWRKQSKNRAETEDDGSSIDAQAVKEILEDAAKDKEEWNNRGKEDSNLSIPLLLQNRIPNGYETEEKLDVSLRPDEPAETNYDEVPIEHFGMAMLRGMGWKEGEGIGRNKKVVPPIEAVVRPKGMGLGADRSTVSMLNKQKLVKGEDESSLSLKKGAYCIVQKGSLKDQYSIVEGLDEDNARVLIKLAIGGRVSTLSQYNIKLVTEEEYEKYSKYINKSKADRFKEEESRKQGGREFKEGQGYSQGNGEQREERKRKYDSYSGSSLQAYCSSSNVETQKDRYIWLRPQIRVRIVDKHYKKGKYYNTKVVVIDMISKDRCVCETDDGKVLEDLCQEMLETVIPKSDAGLLMIVYGKYQGEIGRVMKKDKVNCTVTVQLLSDRVLKLDYNSVCEYVGNDADEY